MFQKLVSVGATIGRQPMIDSCLAANAAPTFETRRILQGGMPEV